MARSGLCSRRAADDLILGGAVMVNGVVVTTPGIRINPETDQVRVQGRDLPLAPAGPGDFLYLAMNKPPGVMTTAHDPQGRKTVMDLLDPETRNLRPFSVGHLDLLSEGLLILTTDGELALRMTHPRWEHPKTYLVRVRGRLDQEKLQTMRAGMRLAEGDRLAPVDVRLISGIDATRTPNPRRTDGGQTLEMTLRQGLNRQIRRMCRDLRLHILQLQRVAQGPIRLGTLPPGAHRPLTPRELQDLRHSLDLNRSAP